MTGRCLAELKQCAKGVTIVEFAMLLPVLLITVMGLFDLSYNMYTNQLLSGAIQQAARNSTIEGASSDEAKLDAIVTSAVVAIVPNAKLAFARKSYTSFSEVNRSEDFTDINTDGLCDNGEPYEDANRNGTWDKDPGTDGFGSARDAVLYSVTVTYPRAVPIVALIPGMSNEFNLKASTVLRNQPWGSQASSGPPPVGSCT